MCGLGLSLDGWGMGKGEWEKGRMGIKRYTFWAHYGHMGKLKSVAKRLPIVKNAYRSYANRNFPGSEAYWESRYAAGGTSGSGSYGRLAHFKAEILNDFVKKNDIKTVIEFGCGDGNQLGLAEYPSFVGLDVSRSALHICIDKFAADKSKSFFLYEWDAFLDNAGLFASDVALSLDVIYHLIEDEVYEAYMRHVFGAGKRFVIVYSSNQNAAAITHQRPRRFTDFVDANLKEWKLKEKIDNRYPYDPANAEETSAADFFIYERK